MSSDGIGAELDRIIAYLTTRRDQAGMGPIPLDTLRLRAVDDLTALRDTLGGNHGEAEE